MTQGGSHTFLTASAVTKADLSHQAFAFGEGVKVEFHHASGNYVVSLPGEPTETFRPGDVTGSAGGTVDYDNGTGKFSLITSGLNYTLLGVWQPDEGNMPLYIGVGGVPTQDADVPKSGGASYAVDPGGIITGPGIAGAYYLQGSGATADLIIDFGIGAVTTSVDLAGVDPNGLGAFDFGTVTGTGSLAATGPGFAGTMTNSGTGTGEFSGALFGPEGVEAGYSWFFHDTTFDVLGSVAGVNIPRIGFTSVFDGLPENTKMASLAITMDGHTQAFGAGPGVIFDPAAQSVVVDTNLGPLTLGHADISYGNVPGLVQFESTDAATGYRRDATFSTPLVGGVPLTYTRFGGYSISDTSNELVGIQNFLFGVPTAGADVPASGSATYSTSFNAVISGGSLPGPYGTSDTQGGSSSFTANFLAGTVSMGLSLAGATDVFDASQPTMDFGTLSGSGTIQSGSPSFAGSLAGSGFNASFVGAFFGPAAAEIGSLFLGDSADYHLNGELFGKKN